MAIENGDFETAGATAWLASGWTSSFVSSLEEAAEFDGNPSGSDLFTYEGFEAGWAVSGDLVFVGALVDPVAAIFNAGAGQTLREDFEVGWGQVLDDLSATGAAQFDSLGLEDFDAWGGYVADLDEDNSSAALFTGVAQEWFDWSDIIGLDATNTILSDGGLEDFEAVAAPVEVRADSSSEVFSLAEAPDPMLFSGKGVVLANVGGALPSPLVEGVLYFTRDVPVTGLTFKLAAYVGGAAIALDDDGSGKHYVKRDPEEWWSFVMATV